MRLKSFQLFLALVLLGLSASPLTRRAQGDPFGPFEEPLISEQELIRKKEWDRKTQLELKQEYENLKSDISLMDKRLKQLRGETRLNQDQYREKEILDELSVIKQRELRILGKLIKETDLAPAFSLPSTLDREIALKDFRGKKNVLLIFYLFDFSPVGTDELNALHLRREKFQERGIQILAISADQPFSQKAFSQQLGLGFPLLSDRGLRVIKAYGVYDRERGTSQRAYFLLNKEGRILWRHVMEDPARKLETGRLLKIVRETLAAPATQH